MGIHLLGNHLNQQFAAAQGSFSKPGSFCQLELTCLSMSLGDSRKVKVLQLWSWSVPLCLSDPVRAFLLLDRVAKLSSHCSDSIFVVVVVVSTAVTSFSHTSQVIVNTLCGSGVVSVYPQKNPSSSTCSCFDRS